MNFAHQSFVLYMCMFLTVSASGLVKGSLGWVWNMNKIEWCDRKRSFYMIGYIECKLVSLFSLDSLSDQKNKKKLAEKGYNCNKRKKWRAVQGPRRQLLISVRRNRAKRSKKNVKISTALLRSIQLNPSIQILMCVWLEKNIVQMHFKVPMKLSAKIRIFTCIWTIFQTLVSSPFSPQVIVSTCTEKWPICAIELFLVCFNLFAVSLDQ